MLENSHIEIKIRESILRAKKLKNTISSSNDISERNYYIEILKREIRELKYLRNKLNTNKNFEPINPEKEFTIEELSVYDGLNGRPAYVAVSGIVYDVSLEPSWGGATHFNLYAGKDLTNEFMRCHGSIDILRNLPKIGILKV